MNATMQSSVSGKTTILVAANPNINLDDFVIISSGRAQEAFKNKVEEAIQLN